MTEQWRAVPGWEGYYEVSDLGNTKALARSVPGRPGVLINRRERNLTQQVTPDGYRVVTFTRANRRTEMRVHRIVLSAFVDPCPGGMEGCHNDGDKANNRLDNLRWDTRSANTRDKVRHGAHPMASKTHCKHGHPFNEINTYHVPSGGRQCRTCRLAAKRRSNNRKRNAA
jgi:hypothetical protein